MNAIVPNELSESNLHGQSLRSRVVCTCKTALQLWNRIKIAQVGEYSTKRAEALERYYNSTSRFRVLSVCVLTPWPALLLGILTECIPLQDPTAGWKANFGAWIRYWVFISSAAIGFLFQIRGATLELSLQKFIMIVVGTGCGTTACLILLADVWAFPLPFGIVIISAPFQTFFVIFVLISIRQEGVTLTASISKALKHRIYLILAQSALVFVYVTFSVIFAKCPPKHQFGLLLLLPVMKLVFKHLVARLAIDSTETLPVVVVFTVDLFKGCMYRSAFSLRGLGGLLC